MQLLCGAMALCQPQQAAFEVGAATVTPNQLLSVFDHAGSVLLAALEAGVQGLQLPLLLDL
jgi:hypothetical protein